MKALNFISPKNIEKKNNICINMFGYENNLVYHVYAWKIWKLYGFIDKRWKEQKTLLQGLFTMF